MKYIRKIVCMLLAVVFIGAVIIGVEIILSVRNVNIDIESYTYPYSDWEKMPKEESDAAKEQVDGFKKIVLEKYRGSLIGFIDEKELAECFVDTGYVFSSVEKVYPCTLNIRLKERRETFAVAYEDGYRVYDALGNYLAGDNDGVNNLDNAPDILVYGTTSDDEIKEVARVSSIFAVHFSALRSVVEKINMQAKDGLIVFTLRCGVKVQIYDYANLTEAKIKKAYDEFSSLSSKEKFSGTIGVTVKPDGEIGAVYFAEDLPNIR